MKPSLSLSSACLALLGVLAWIASATPARTETYKVVITTSEGVGAFNSTLSGTNVMTFDDMQGIYTDYAWQGVGVFDRLNVIRPNVYGGAPSEASPSGTNYAVEGLGSVRQTILYLDQASSYFGLYWSAGDAANNLQFYSNEQLVANFTTNNLMNLLPRSYFGNPVTTGPYAGGNTREPYGFINFFGDENTSWDTIVFTNTSTSGFEADNYTTRTEGWKPAEDGALPGTPAVVVQSEDGAQTVAKITSVTVAPDYSLEVTAVDVSTGITSMLSFAPAAPAAPAPPLAVLAAFGAALALKSLRRKKAPELNA